MKKNTTPITDAISSIRIDGNLIHHTWFKHITKTKKTKHGVESKKSDLLAINILADLFYWHKNTIVRDEHTNEIISECKKFSSDKLQRSYQTYADMFGTSKDDVKESIDLLEDLGLLTREFRVIEVSGVKMYNVVFLELVPAQLIKINTINLDKDPPPQLTPTPLSIDPIPPSQLTHTNTETSTKNSTDSSSVFSEKEKTLSVNSDFISKKNQVNEDIENESQHTEVIPVTNLVGTKKNKKTNPVSSGVDPHQEQFETFRKLYPGRKNSNLEHFKKHKDWETELPKLIPYIVSYNKFIKTTKHWMPAPQNLKTFVNQRSWTFEYDPDKIAAEAEKEMLKLNPNEKMSILLPENLDKYMDQSTTSPLILQAKAEHFKKLIVHYFPEKETAYKVWDVIKEGKAYEKVSNSNIKSFLNYRVEHAIGVPGFFK